LLRRRFRRRDVARRILFHLIDWNQSRVSASLRGEPVSPSREVHP
jgi:hypothetical protein